MTDGTLPGHRPDAPPGPRPAPPHGFFSAITPAACVHDWAHAGVRWWIDASDPPTSWVRYVDQYHCRRCLEVASRPVDYCHRLGDLAFRPGTFAADEELASRLSAQSRFRLDRIDADLNPPAVDPAAEDGVPAT